MSNDKYKKMRLDMKNFIKWLKEDAPANCISGQVRGLGTVTGEPTGTISNYASQNVTDALDSSDEISDLFKAHNDLHASRVADFYK